MANTTPFDSPPLQGAWKKVPGRNPVIDNLTTIHLLKLRIKDLEEDAEHLYEALCGLYNCVCIARDAADVDEDIQQALGEALKAFLRHEALVTKPDDAHPNPLEKT